jgi:transcriptional regulator
MPDRLDVLQGTLALIVMRTLDTQGDMHAFGIARRIEATSRNAFRVNYGTLYPALLKLEQQGFVRAEWRASDNNRRAKFYAITRSGRAQLAREEKQWKRTNEVLGLFLSPAPTRS